MALFFTPDRPAASQESAVQATQQGLPPGGGRGLHRAPALVVVDEDGGKTAGQSTAGLVTVSTPRASHLLRWRR